VHSGRLSNWLHDRESFFKYTPRNTALAILDSRSLRWSSPSTFNDPFDTAFDMRLDNDYARLRPLVLESLWSAHYSPEGIEAGNELGKVIRSLRSRLPKLSRGEFSREFGEVLDESNRKFPSIGSELNSTLRQAMKYVNILCLSNRSESILMWSHYAQQHTGVVLELACVPQLDSPWGAAVPGKYSEMPLMLEDDFLVRLWSGQVSIDPLDLVNKFVTAKATDWAYEHEWRVVLHLTDPNHSAQDIRFDPDELAGVYLGCGMSQENREEIVAKVRRSYRRTKIFLAEKRDRRFGLRFLDY
jgi:Protein of unknown function (DUF2971)